MFIEQIKGKIKRNPVSSDNKQFQLKNQSIKMSWPNVQCEQ